MKNYKNKLNSINEYELYIHICCLSFGRLFWFHQCFLLWDQGLCSKKLLKQLQPCKTHQSCIDRILLMSLTGGRSAAAHAQQVRGRETGLAEQRKGGKVKWCQGRIPSMAIYLLTCMRQGIQTFFLARHHDTSSAQSENVWCFASRGGIPNNKFSATRDWAIVVFDSAWRWLNNKLT